MKRSGLSSVEVSLGVCPCDMVNSSYFPLKEIRVIATFVKTVNNFICGECEGLVGRANAAYFKG